jgi:hypothetical protein
VDKINASNLVTLMETPSKKAWEKVISAATNHQGCQIFLDTIYQNGGNYIVIVFVIATKLPKWQ